MEANRAHHWELDRLGEFKDYTGIPAFFMELCPPHHMFSEYIYNEDVYYLEGDELKKVPFEKWDQKRQKLVPRKGPIKKPKIAQE